MSATFIEAFCSLRSRSLDEPLYGTAVNATVWLLLEYRGPWSAQATTDNDLPPAVQAWLQLQLDSLENGRVQFIQQQGTPVDAPVTLFVAVLTRQPRVYRFQADTYDELLTLDVAEIVRGGPAFAANVHAPPLYLVCTNGRRDACCAKFGLALYRELSDVVGDAAWQTTHLGGHRFAPTLMAFPEGVCYGRVDPPELPQFLTAQRDRRISLSKLRGQAAFDRMTQVADYYLRRETGNHALGAFAPLDTTPLSAEEWEVAFLDGNGRVHTIHLRSAAPLAIQASCGSEKLKQVPHFNLVKIRFNRR